MSFILDALKKSEENRRQEAAPGTKKRILIMGGAGQRRWPVWLLIGLLPVALLAGWWLGRAPLTSVQPDTRSLEQPQAASGQRPAPGAQGSVAVVPQASAPAATASQAAPAEGQPPPAQNLPAQPAPPETPAIAPAPVPIQPVPPVPAQNRRAEPAQPAAQAAGPAREETLPSYDELSPAMRSRLPELEISLHFYSADPARRMVRINGALLHEGSEVADGLTIYEITPRSTIFDFLGLLFAIPGPGR
jgi:general secretion pathway protein B